MAVEGGVSVNGGVGKTSYENEGNTPALENENGVVEPVNDTTNFGWELFFEPSLLIRTDGNVSVGIKLFSDFGLSFRKDRDDVQYITSGTVDSGIFQQSDGTVETCPDFTCEDKAKFNSWHVGGGLNLYLGFGDRDGFDRLTVEPGYRLNYSHTLGDNYAPVADNGDPLVGLLRQDKYPGISGSPELSVAALLTSNENRAWYVRLSGATNSFLNRPNTTVEMTTQDGQTTIPVDLRNGTVTLGLELRGRLERKEDAAPPPPLPPPADEDCDDDGLLDTREQELGTEKCDPDSDNDGLDDWLETDGGEKTDTDGDGTIDALDLDSDDDTLLDRDESGNSDPDNNPFSDLAHARVTNTECGNVPDFRNADDDCDTIPTKTEINDAGDFGATKINGGHEPNDADDDDTLNWYDTNSDLNDDNKPDKVELRDDGDADQILNYMDADDNSQPLAVISADKTHIEIKEKIYFELDKAVIKEKESGVVLLALANLMNSEEGLKLTQIEIQGYASPEGTEEHNLDLSTRRAEAVKIWLETHGRVEQPARLSSRGFGELPLTDPATGTVITSEKVEDSACKKQESACEDLRRVEFSIKQRSE